MDKQPREPRPDILRKYAELLSDVSDLVDIIEKGQKDKETTHAYDFVDLHEAVIPESVTDQIGPIVALAISIDLPNPTDQESTSISIDLYSKSQTYHISRIGDGVTEPEAHTDTIIDLMPHAPEERSALSSYETRHLRHNSESGDIFPKRLKEVAPLSKSQLNALIMSLASPDSERGYEMFAEVNLLSRPALAELQELLTMQARRSNEVDQSSQGYAFTSNDISFAYHKIEGQPTAFSIVYPSRENGQPIIVRCDLDTKFQVAFSSVDEVPTLSEDEFVDGTTDFYPTLSDLEELQNAVRAEVLALERTQEYDLTDDEVENSAQAPDDTNPEAAFTNSGNDYFSPDYTDEALKRLEDDF